jgi:hypothetical protein
MRSTGLRIATANDPNYGLGVLDGRPAGRSADVPLAVIPPLDTPPTLDRLPRRIRPTPGRFLLFSWGLSRSTVSRSGICQREHIRPVSASTVASGSRADDRANEPARSQERGHTNALRQLPRARHEGSRWNATDPVAGQHRARNRAARAVLLRHACGRRCRPRLCQPAHFCPGRMMKRRLSSVSTDQRRRFRGMRSPLGPTSSRPTRSEFLPSHASTTAVALSSLVRRD